MGLGRVFTGWKPVSRSKICKERRLIQGHWEVILGVVEADVLDHFPEQGYVVGQQSVLDAAAEEVAEYSAEILVAREGEETAGIGEHSDESAQQAHICQDFHLLFHTVLLVEEPPG